MKWQELLLAVIRCELKARFNAVSGWQISAKGALPIVLLAISILVLWRGQ